jgi:hypothetical protein
MTYIAEGFDCNSQTWGIGLVTKAMLKNFRKLIPDFLIALGLYCNLGDIWYR